MMKAAAVKSKKKNESRAAANAVFQKKNDPKGALGLAGNRPGPAAGRLTSASNGPAGSSKFIRLYAPSPVSFTGYDRHTRDIALNLKKYTGRPIIQRSQTIQFNGWWDLLYAAKDWLKAYWNTDGSITGTVNYIEFLITSIVNLLEGVTAQSIGLGTEMIATLIGAAKEILTIITDCTSKNKDKTKRKKAIASLVEKSVIFLTDLISIIVILSTNTPYGSGAKLAVTIIKFIAKAIAQWVKGYYKVLETKQGQIPSKMGYDSV